MTPDHPDYRSTVKAKDKMNVVALVVDATTATSLSTKLQEKLRKIRKHASQRGKVALFFHLNIIWYNVTSSKPEMSFHNSQQADDINWLILDIVDLAYT